MASNLRSWGILGNPSPQKIKEYTNMPVGSFRNMVKNLQKTKKGKVLSEYTVYVTKREVNATRGLLKVEAFDFSEAVELTRIRKEEVVWDEKPYKEKYEEFVHSSFDPISHGVPKSYV